MSRHLIATDVVRQNLLRTTLQSLIERAGYLACLQGVRGNGSYLTHRLGPLGQLPGLSLIRRSAWFKVAFVPFDLKARLTIPVLQLMDVEGVVLLRRGSQFFQAEDHLRLMLADGFSNLQRSLIPMRLPGDVLKHFIRRAR